MNKYLIVLLPSLFMILSSYFIDFNTTYSNIIKSFTGGLLLMAGIGVFKEEIDEKKIWGIVSFILSIVLLYVKELKDTSVLYSFYFDCVSDGLLLGTLMATKKNNISLLPLILALTFEMSITSISVKKQLETKGIKDSKNKTAVGGIILALAIIVGVFIGKKVNKNVINGIGAASMLWLSIGSFLNNVNEKHLIFVFAGIFAGIFID